MLPFKATLLCCALVLCACEIAPDAPEQGSDEVLARTPTTRQLKLDRMVSGPEFSAFRLRQQGRVAHYDGLRTQPDLANQILFQLYRTEHLHAADDREDAREARRAERRGALTVVSPSRSPSPTARGFIKRGRSLRRHAYRTPFFNRLKRNRTAVTDVITAIDRPQVPHSERVELLRLLHALVQDRADPAAVRAAKDALLAYAMRSSSPTADDFTPYLAFAYYARLETDERARQSNGARFSRTSHPPLPAHLARRMYSTTTYAKLRAATRTLGVSR